MLTADLVVSNADAAHLYTSMIPKRQQAWSSRLKLRLANYSMGLFVLYFGARKAYPGVAHHTILLGFARIPSSRNHRAEATIAQLHAEFTQRASLLHV